jgi:hypothetical protein
MPVVIATWEAEIRKIVAQDQPRQKVGDNPSQPIAGLSGTHLLSQAIWKVEIRRIAVPGQQGQKTL